MNLLQGFGLPTAAKGKDPHKLLHLMGADKKNRFGYKVIILPKGIGQAVIVKDCSDAEILKAWTAVTSD